MKKSKNTFKLTKSAILKIKSLIKNNYNKNIKFRIYITGGGCSGFQYGFKFEKKNNKTDFIICQSNIFIIIDPISLQYLMGSKVDYIENLNGSKFIIKNPNSKSTCSCGASFNI
ncbi:iron-sulfur cluster insertion protein ErpA [Buchnera aphidicola]|uniref:iron-sulfur cluster insertion protein ErpA n=1 Tax=Buchnera aphidicola TaxID=9 RepID=UPI002236F31C|nr:iron-sulfur cluster insertion protein ErpA [Buchnera aphidicola]MCW5197764.1 iron-sulfur cluster insertion protein ErpA [Buchnera aphidicola (Chaitophorus viminalis)]